MYFETFSEFLAMGRHGVYVWSAYGISTVLIAINLIVMARRSKAVRRDIARMMRRESLQQDNDQ
jgi:heme exporter protein D